jgi:hypothetical protein
MYSPKIKEEFIPTLYKISTLKRMPMTKLVNQIIKDYLETNSHIQSEKTVEELNEKLDPTTASSLPTGMNKL